MYSYRLSKQIISSIISETCSALYSVLKEIVFPKFEEPYWKNNSDVFWEKWNYPNCLGALDGKHIIIEVMI